MSKEFDRLYPQTERKKREMEIVKRNEFQIQFKIDDHEVKVVISG